jgi:glycosyltransferase involved in cell wall biosynthesis/exopolysaccharide biosynthesis predicted pyruvyltransferase EpsI
MILDYIQQSGPYYFKSYDCGNAGDFLIAITVRQLFKENNLNIPYLGKDEEIPQHCNIIYGGGGGIMVPHWHNLEHLADFFSDAKIDHCLILPQSIYDCDQLVDTFDERFVVLCRDYNSYNYCISRNKKAQFYVADDIALSFNAQQFLLNYPAPLLSHDDLKFRQHFLDSIHTLPNGRKLLLAMREDCEGTYNHGKNDLFRSYKTIDLSTIKSGYCGDRVLNEKYLYLFLTYINEVDIILTDRLHCGIGAYLLNKEVYLLDNNYGKLSSVYECSLADKPNVHYLTTADNFPYWEDLSRVRSQQPLVSVIIPIYNVERFLVQCLDSVIHQAYTNLEIICVDDGSTDNSPSILHNYALKDPRIVEITQKNAGLSAARNTALKVVKGKYTLFLDSDDWLDRRALEILVKKSELEHLDMLKFSSTLCYECSGRKELDPYHSYDSFLPEYYLNNPFTYKDLHEQIALLWRIPVTVWSCLFRTEYIREHNITFPSGLNFEDNFFSHKSFLSGGVIACIDKLLHFRSIHKDSITGNRTNYFPHLCEIRKLIFNYILTLNEPQILKSYVQYCVPQLWEEFRAAPLLIQRQTLALFQTTVGFLLSNHDVEELWPSSDDGIRLILRMLFSNGKSSINLYYFDHQKLIKPNDLKSQMSFIKNKSDKSELTFIIFCGGNRQCNRVLDSIVQSSPQGSEIFLLFNRRITDSEEIEIKQLTLHRSFPIYCIYYTNNRPDLVDQIIEVCSGEYIKFYDLVSFCDKANCYTVNHSLSMISERQWERSPDMILSLTQSLDLSKSIESLHNYFFKKSFLQEKNIQFIDSSSNLLNSALSQANSLVLSHIDELIQDRNAMANRERQLAPSFPGIWERYAQIFLKLNSCEQAIFAECFIAPMLERWFYYSSMPDFKHSLAQLETYLELIGKLQDSSLLQLGKDVRFLISLSRNRQEKWRLHLLIPILRLKIICSQSSGRKVLRHTIRYIRYLIKQA